MISRRLFNSNSKAEAEPACQNLNAIITNERMRRIFQKSLAPIAQFAQFASKKRLPKTIRLWDALLRSLKKLSSRIRPDS
jgi:hypothetical protein